MQKWGAQHGDLSLFFAGNTLILLFQISGPKMGEPGCPTVISLSLFSAGNTLSFLFQISGPKMGELVGPTVISLFSALVHSLWSNLIFLLQISGAKMGELGCPGGTGVPNSELYPSPLIFWEHFDFLISDIWTKNEGTRVPNSDLSLSSLLGTL